MKGMSVWVDDYETRNGTRYRVCWKHPTIGRGSIKVGADRENAAQIRNNKETAFLRRDQHLPDTSKTVGQLYREYIEWQVQNNKDSAKSFADNAVKYFAVKYANRIVSELAKEDIIAFKNDIYTLRTDDGKLKWVHNGNLKRMRYVKTMLRHAVGDCITENKLTEIFDKKDPKLKLRKADSVARFLEQREIADLLNIGCEFNDELADIIKFAIGTLMRRGEYLSLEKKQIRNYTINLSEDQTKSQDARIVVIPRELRYIVDRVKDGRIFPGWKGILKSGKPDYSRYGRAFARAVKRSIGGRCRPHDMRHTGISILISKGWSDRQIMKMSGHKTAAAFAIYAHLRIDDIVSKMDETSFNFPVRGPELEVIGA